MARLHALGPALLLAAAGVGSVAERARPEGGARQARPVLLRLVPREGDTLRTRFEQDVEMTTAEAAGTGSAEGRTRRSGMLVLSRSMVERSGPDGALVVAVTDSVALDIPGSDPRALDQARRGMQGRRARFRMSPVGASELLAAGSGVSADATGRFPGTLPTEAVAVGATWTRHIPLPWGAADRPGGKLEVVFRLDSLAAGGVLAHVSMRGALSRHAGPNAKGARSSTTGTFTGALVVDLRRGWMMDSFTRFAMTTVVTPPAGAAGAPPPAPARVKLRVTQRLRAM